MFLGLGVERVGAQDVVVGFRLTGGSTVIIISDESLSRFLTKHARPFISLGIQRDFLGQRNPLNQPDPFQPIVIEAQRFGSEDVELDRVIERLGRLIRDAEREKGDK
jgi:hypothetical protein